MNKNELHEAWGHYCDTDKLVNRMMSLLTKYRHPNTENGVCYMLDAFFKNKQKLIDMFKASPRYAGDLRIIVDLDIERELNSTDIRNFMNNFVGDVNAASAIVSYKDDDGKTLEDYQMTGYMSIKASDLLTGEIRDKFNKNFECKRRFNHDGSTVESRDKYSRFVNGVYLFGRYCSPVMNEHMTANLANCNIAGSYSVGMKTSRAFNRMCTLYKVNTLPGYERLFAKYSDMVAAGKRKMKFFISLNPLDYLTMSFGNSWASCHTIDKTNVRNTPNSYHGMYCGGTVSYMLDATSIITYVHNDIPDDVEEGKIYRNMFHYKDGKLIQGRIYPQGKDGSTDLYQCFRNAMQKEISNMLGVENSWTKRNSRCYEETTTDGVHYPDYLNFSDCNISFHNNVSDAKDVIVNIGAKRVCPNCGRDMSNDINEGRLVCYECD